jgi:proline iminopeptidase
MAEGYITTPDGVRLYFQTRGEGSQTVVCPGGFYFADDFGYLAKGRTLIFYDPRNRGRSDLEDEAQPSRGVHDDVADLEAVRRHFGLETMALMGHSYIGVVIVVYAMRHVDRVNRAVLLSPAEPFHGKQYPADLMNVDDLLRDALARLGQLQASRGDIGSEEFCRRFWSILTPVYVANPADADKVTWARCDQPHEAGFFKYWIGSILPSLQRLALTPDDVARAVMPTLIVHGRKDRSAPYGGARDWGMLLPNARLLTLDHAAHATWLEAPDDVHGPVGAFLDGIWPSAAAAVPSGGMSA